MITIIVIILLAMVYVALPFWVKLVCFVLNVIFPDPIPIIDEVLMVAAMINNFLHLELVIDVIDWMIDNIKLVVCILIVILGFIIYFVCTKV